jgi:hypothetical protein
MPRTHTLNDLLACCPQAGFPTFPARLVLGTRGKNIWWIQKGGKIRRRAVALCRDAAGTLVPALTERLGHQLATAMTTLRQFGVLGRNARPGCRPYAAQVASE